MLIRASPSSSHCFEFRPLMPVSCSKAGRRWSGQRRLAKKVANVWELESISSSPFFLTQSSKTSRRALAPMCPAGFTDLASYLPVCTPGPTKLFAVSRRWQVPLWIGFLEHRPPFSARLICLSSKSQLGVTSSTTFPTLLPCFFFFYRGCITVDMEVMDLPSSQSTMSPWRTWLTHLYITRKQPRRRHRVGFHQWRNECSNDGDQTALSI